MDLIRASLDKHLHIAANISNRFLICGNLWTTVFSRFTGLKHSYGSLQNAANMKNASRPGTSWQADCTRSRWIFISY
ncbi:MAG: hypothetical protein B7Y04_09880 [Gallionellales bacterium 24-53-125]|jgi:hypothetical protein|nr:MAG: hypothetical protein B7Y04_09880 [Gallionellales bacterium 24-53-125]